jgi:hypothetical protein
MPPGTWQRSDSSAVEAFRYDADRGLLQIVFVDGLEAYDYPCPPALYERFLQADSKGRFVNQVLKRHADDNDLRVRASRWEGW